MNLLDIIKSANSSLFRNKTRTFLTILAIFIGSFTIVLNAAINAGVNDYIDKQVDSIGGDGYIEIMPAAMMEQASAMMGGDDSVKEYDPDKGSGVTASIADEDLEAIKKIDGLSNVKAYHIVSTEYITSASTDKEYDLNLDVTPDNSLTIDMSAGRQTNADSTDYEIAITERFVKPLGFKDNEDAIGKTVKIAIKQTAKCYLVTNSRDCLATIEAKVVGVQAPGIFSVDDARANPALYDALYELSMEGMPENVRRQTFAVTASADPEKVDEIKDKLTELGFTAMTVEDEVGMIKTFFDVILVVFNIFGAIALLAAAIGIINTLFMSVQERTREIGLMKALGMGKEKIFLSFSIEAILLGFWGSLVGICFSMIAGYAGNAIAHQGFLADFPTFELVKFEPLTMLGIVVIIMLIAFIAGTAPARKAARQNPIDALRYE